MIEIALFILKGIGIILAVILGILLVVLCLTLFVPVRYRSEVSVSDKEEGAEKKKIRAHFCGTWLLHLVRLAVFYEESVRIQAKVLFFTVFDTARAEKQSRKTKRRKKKQEEKTEEKPEEKPEEKQPEQEIREDTEELSDDVTEDMPADDVAEDMPADSEKPPEKNAEEDREKPKFNLKQRISDILYTIRNFCDKLKEIREKGDAVKELWLSDHMRKSRSLLGKQLRYLLKHTKPRKLKGYLEFGFKDPAATGYAMALYGILSSVWNPDIIVKPDFEKQVLSCNIMIKGKIRVCHFIRAALRLLLSKDVRHVIRDIKK